MDHNNLLNCGNFFLKCVLNLQIRKPKGNHVVTLFELELNLYFVCAYLNVQRSFPN